MNNFGLSLSKYLKLQIQWYRKRNTRFIPGMSVRSTAPFPIHASCYCYGEFSLKFRDNDWLIISILCRTMSSVWAIFDTINVSGLGRLTVSTAVKFTLCFCELWHSVVMGMNTNVSGELGLTFDKRLRKLFTTYREIPSVQVNTAGFVLSQITQPERPYAWPLPSLSLFCFVSKASHWPVAYKLGF
jgi:hypothetical protein